jgi:Na+-driven multidrug efflux pump
VSKLRSRAVAAQLRALNQSVSVGVDYLHRAAPFYPCYGFGMALYFASQGAGSVLWPFIAGCVRLAVVTIGGWYWITVLHGSLKGLFWIIAASLVCSALSMGWLTQPAYHGEKLPSLASRKEPA